MGDEVTQRALNLSPILGRVSTAGRMGAGTVFLLVFVGGGCSGAPAEAPIDDASKVTDTTTQSSSPYSNGPSLSEVMARYRREKAVAIADPAVWELDEWEDRTAGEVFPRWGPDSQWVYAGPWISHPPLEFAVALVGEEAVRECVDRFRAEDDAWSCRIEVDDCMTLQLFAQGNVQFTMRTSGDCGREPEALRISHSDFTTPEQIDRYERMWEERDGDAARVEDSE